MNSSRLVRRRSLRPQAQHLTRAWVELAALALPELDTALRSLARHGLPTAAADRLRGIGQAAVATVQTWARRLMPPPDAVRPMDANQQREVYAHREPTLVAPRHDDPAQGVHLSQGKGRLRRGWVAYDIRRFGAHKIANKSRTMHPWPGRLDSREPVRPQRSLATRLYRPRVRT